MSDQTASPPPYPWLKSYPAGLDWAASIDADTVAGLLDQAVAQWPDHVALYFMGRRISYRTLDNMVLRAMAVLAGQGIVPGDRVGLLMPNCPDFVACYYAILRLGAVVVNINPLYAMREINHLVLDGQVRHVVTVDLAVIMDKLQPVLAQKPDLRVLVHDFAAGLPLVSGKLFRLFRASQRSHWRNWPEARQIVSIADAPKERKLPDIRVKPDDLAVLQYTGGTTGIPKAAMLTHRNLTANTNQCRLWLGATNPGGLREGKEVFLAVLPLFHSFAMTVGLNLAMAIGAEIVLMPRFELKSMLKLIAQRKITILPAVPGIFSSLSLLPARERHQISTLQICVSGGAPLPNEIRNRFEQANGIALVEGYGLTEAGPVVAVNPLSGGRAGSIGLPMPNTIIEIHDPERHGTLMPIGERGEICVRGPQIMQGYWQHPEQTAAVLQDGLLRTGDIGYLDQDGYCFVVDRIKDLILVNGFNVYPRIVEEAIHQHPSVQEVVVGGVPDARRGEMVKAWIYLKPGTILTEEALRQFLQDRISPIEMPRQIVFSPEPLPKTLIGKLSRKALTEEALNDQKSET